MGSGLKNRLTLFGNFLSSSESGKHWQNYKNPLDPDTHTAKQNRIQNKIRMGSQTLGKGKTRRTEIRAKTARFHRLDTGAVRVSC